MYERSIIVLERYLQKILELKDDNIIEQNYMNFSEIVNEVEEFQDVTIEESRIIEEFDTTVAEIEFMQKKQSKLIDENQKLEEVRSSLFSDLGEEARVLENKFLKIEKVLERNNLELVELRKEFIKNLDDFGIRQRERNKCEKTRRITEARHIEFIKGAAQKFNSIDVKTIKTLKEFLNSDKEYIKNELLQIMVKNGKNEKVKFDENVIKKVIKVRMDISEREIESYILIYERTKKILSEIDNENLKLDKYKKIIRDVGAKNKFFEAQKDYIASFLDYERMSAISGQKAHKKLMEDAYSNFELDMMQVNKLYDLLMREIASKSTKKAYDELYNNTYLQNIEDKEKNFEQEVTTIKTNLATVINSSYWRIEGIKNIYTIFDDIVTNEYGKDLSDYKQKVQEFNFDFDDEDTNEYVKYKSKRNEYEEKEEVKEIAEKIVLTDEEEKEKYLQSIEDILNNSDDDYEYTDEYDDDEYESDFKFEFDDYKDELEDDENDDSDEIEYEIEEDYEEEDYDELEDYEENLGNIDDIEDDIEAILENARKQSRNKEGKKKAKREKRAKHENDTGLFNKLFGKN